MQKTKYTQRKFASKTFSNDFLLHFNFDGWAVARSAASCRVPAAACCVPAAACRVPAADAVCFVDVLRDGCNISSAASFLFRGSLLVRILLLAGLLHPPPVVPPLPPPFLLPFLVLPLVHLPPLVPEPALKKKTNSQS